MTRRILFIPFPETGHLNPSFKLAKTLRARGHDVLYASLPDWEGRVRREGLGFVPLFEQTCPLGFVQRQAAAKQLDPVRALINHVAEVTGGAAEPYIFQEVSKLLRLARPDLVLVDFILPPVALMVMKLGFPLLMLNVLLQTPGDDIKPEYEPLKRVPEIILCPEEFDFPPSARPHPHGVRFYAEASIDLGREEPPFDWAQVDGSRRLLYCSLGSQSHLIQGSRDFFRTVVEALASRPEWQLILAAGSHLRADEFAPLPPNALVVSSAPQLSILPKASAMITHGGIGSVKECIFFGVPMVVFPAIRDQPNVAARVVYHKLGVKGNLKKVSVSHVQSLLEAVSDPLIKRRVEAMCRKFREIEDSGRGAQFVERLLAEQAPRA